MGYLLIDNRANHGGVSEVDTLQCPHCGSHFVHEPQVRGAFCMKCGAPVCERESCVTECKPFWARVSEGFRRALEARARKEAFAEMLDKEGRR